MDYKRQRISIIIPAYNEARHVGACLESIAAQTVAPYEVFVINNNSTDATAEIARRFPFVQVLDEPQQGIGHARNRGFEAATGDMLARIDADTHLPADWVARLQEFFADQHTERSIFTGGARFYNLRTGRVTAKIYNFVIYQTNRLLLGYYFPWGSNSALPHDAWLRVRGAASVRPDIHEDLDLGIRLHKAGYRTVYRPDICVGARARRILSERDKLWPYLAMWPRTFYVNHKKRGLLVWPAAAAVWLGAYGILFAEYLCRLLAPQRKRT